MQHEPERCMRLEAFMAVKNSMMVLYLVMQVGTEVSKKPTASIFSFSAFLPNIRVYLNSTRASEPKGNHR
jgi:hypothetical protein